MVRGWGWRCQNLNSVKDGGLRSLEVLILFYGVGWIVGWTIKIVPNIVAGIENVGFEKNAC